MPVKRVLILANSIKKGQRCVAGRELLNNEGRAKLGKWVRPVSNLGEGELHRQHYTLRSRKPARVLDVVDMMLAQQQQDPGQPENWRIADHVPWYKVRSLDPVHLPRFEESPPDLWLESTSHTDRISVEAQDRRFPQSSIVLIRPRNLKIRLWQEHNAWKGCDQQKRAAVFTYAGQKYKLTITDPVFNDTFCTRFPAVRERPREFVPPGGDSSLLCISLTPPFNGYHYKVVASVLMQP